LRYTLGPTLLADWRGLAARHVQAHSNRELALLRHLLVLAEE